MRANTPKLNELWANTMIKELIHHGVRYFCISPGSRSTPLVLAASAHPLAETFVHFDERGMSFHGLGYAKASKSPVCLIVTSGTAAGNLLPAVMEAFHDEIPLIVLTADRPPELRNTGANQATDQVRLYQNFVRHQVDLPCSDASIPTSFLGTTIAQAMGFANGENKGPVHINCMLREPFFSTDRTRFFSPPITHSAHTSIFPGKKGIAPAELSALYDEFAEYEKGLILVGGNQSWDSLTSLLSLAERLKWPIFPDILSPVRRERKSPFLTLGYDLMLKSIGLNEDLSPDAILQFGDRFVSKKVFEWLSLKKPKVYIHVAPNLYRKDINHSITHRVESSPETFCRSLVNRAEERKASSWSEFWSALSKNVDESIHHYFAAESTYSEPALFHTLSKTVEKDTALFLSNSMPIRDADAFFLPKHHKGPIYANRGLSGIDGNIATAIGIAKAEGRRVLAVVGDLAFLHDINSLAQLQSLSTPISFLVINNNGGGIFSHLPIAKKEKEFRTFFQTPHSAELKHTAPLFGLSYSAPISLEALQEDLKKGSAEHRLIEVKTDAKTNGLVRQAVITNLQEIQASASLKLS